MRRLAVQPGPSEAIDTLPAPPSSAGTEALARYQVAIFNDRERTAGWSAETFAATGPAPSPLREFRAETTPQGVLLRWHPEDGGSQVMLDRRRVPVPGAPPRKAGKPQLPGTEPAEQDGVRLTVPTTAGGEPIKPDAGGTLDAEAHRGETYTYTAVRVRKVAIVGHALELRSDESPPVTVTMPASFRPAPPQGLEAIATTVESKPAIDLSWRPNIEPDLLGYRVYRQEVDASGATGGAATLLTGTPIPVPGFRDTTVRAGHRYTYTATAVTTGGQESSSGASATEDVPQT